MDIRAGQKLAWENKVAKGFNTTDVPLEFCLLQGEVAEAFDAWRKGRGSVGEELADVALFLFSLAEMTGVDLQGEVESKIEKNPSRSYSRLPNGVLVKDASGPAQLRESAARGYDWTSWVVVSVVMRGEVPSRRANASWYASMIARTRSRGGAAPSRERSRAAMAAGLPVTWTNAPPRLTTSLARLMTVAGVMRDRPWKSGP
jgi:hypothetical protein